LDDFWVVDVAKISPNTASERLKLVVPALAILFDVTDSSVDAAFRPVKDV
jgi:hypothetical protein